MVRPDPFGVGPCYLFLDGFGGSIGILSGFGVCVRGVCLQGRVTPRNGKPGTMMLSDHDSQAVEYTFPTRGSVTSDTDHEASIPRSF